MSNDDDVLRPESIQHFDKLLSNHDKVICHSFRDDRIFDFTLFDGRQMTAYLSGFYILGIYDYWDIRERCPEANFIIHASNWYSHPSDVSEQAAIDKVGIFHMRDFMGALNFENYWKYLPPEEYREKMRQRKRGA